MQPKEIPIDKRGATWTIISIAVVSVYQSLYFLAPEFLAVPLYEGSFLTIAFLLGTLAVAIPVAAGWWMIRGDKPDGETFETTDH